MARPTKLTPEVQKRLCDALAGGNTRADAAHYAGIALNSLKNWITRGRKGKAGYREFLAAVKKAEADCAVRNVALIQQAAQGTKDREPDWKAAAWWLERRRPKDYGNKGKLDVSLTAPQIEEAIAAELARLAGLGEGPDAGASAVDADAGPPRLPLAAVPRPSDLGDVGGGSS